jgi:hypothetical protein
MTGHLLDIVAAIAEAEGHRLEKVGEDSIEFYVSVLHGEERVLTFLPGLIIDGLPVVEFSTAFSSIAMENSRVLPSVAWSLAERNRMALDVGWACDAGGPHQHVVYAKTRIEGRHLSQRRFSRAIADLMAERTFFQKQFISRSGHLVVYPLDVVLSKGKESIAPTAGTDEDSPSFSPWENPHYIRIVRGLAESKKLQITALDAGSICISFVSREVLVRIFVAVLQSSSNGDWILRFSSVAKQLPEDGAEVEAFSERLLRRNAATLNAYWALEYDDGSFFALITRNTWASDLDHTGFYGILGSFVQEYHFAAAELGGFL